MLQQHALFPKINRASPFGKIKKGQSPGKQPLTLDLQSQGIDNQKITDEVKTLLTMRWFGMGLVISIRPQFSTLV
jgi:hypothetical protein